MEHRDDEALVAEFCVDLGRLRGLLRGPASPLVRAVVEQAVAEARAGRPIGGHLARLPAGRAGSQPLEQAPSEAAPGAGAYVCPRDACRRVESRRPGSVRPWCDVHDHGLRFVIDDP